MIKHSLFADQEREAKLNELGDTLRVLEQHVDFATLAHHFQPTDGACSADSAVVQFE